MTGNQTLTAAVEAFICTTNASDIAAALALFTPDAVIDDPSVGERFVGHHGIQDYLNRFFIGYKTATRLLSVEMSGDNKARVRVDFTGDFGHEIGVLDVEINPAGLVVNIIADLE